MLKTKTPKPKKIMVDQAKKELSSTKKIPMLANSEQIAKSPSLFLRLGLSFKLFSIVKEVKVTCFTIFFNQSTTTTK